MDGFQLTDDNYYSREADIHYMSCSQYQNFKKCEAAAIARLRGIWEPQKQSDALFQGQYFHSALESPEAFNKFCEENGSKIFKTKIRKDRKTGIETVEIVGKYAAFELLDKMLETVRTDPFMSQVLAWPGENEKFLIGNVGGIPWRMKMDKYAMNRRIIDYKTSANLWETFYNIETRQRQSFIEEYGYMMRAAVYGEIERQNANAEDFPIFLILAVSKQEPPDRESFCLNDDVRWNLELEKVKAKVPHIQRLKNGEESPKRCGMCEYCRATKRIHRIKSYTDLMPEFRFDPDNIECDDYGGTSVFDTL